VQVCATLALSSAGSFVINDGGTLELSFGLLSDAVNFTAGAVGTLQLDVTNGANLFTGILSGLSTGDAIDFANTVVTKAAIDGNTLTATLANGQTTNIIIAGSLPVGDSLQIQIDGKGGTELVLATGPLPPPPTYIWNDGTSGDWSRAADWSGGMMPDGMSNATIAGSSTETVTVSSNQATNVLTLSDANATLAVTNSASLSAYGGLAVSAAHEIDLTGTLSIGGGGTQILDNTIIKIGGLASSIPGFPPFAEYGWLNVQQDTVLVLGPNLTVDLAYGQINASTPSATPGGFTLINDGTITADTNGGSININAWAFDNEGTIAVSNGDTLNLYAQGTSFNPIPLPSYSPLSVNNGTISVGSGGHLTFSGYMGGSGSFVINDGGTLELSFGMLSDAVTFAAGAMGTLQLDGAIANGSTQFTGTLSGLSTGDAIDFANTVVTKAAIDGNTLTATLANGQTTNITVAGSLPVGDSLQIQIDGKGGTEVVVICFMVGTMIRTPAGEVAVETLKRGDLVSTSDGRAMPVSWLGRQTVSTVFADPRRVLPIRIRAGALGENVPSRDLLLSPDHAIRVDDVLIQAGALVNETSIVRETNVPQTFTYYHVELDDHSLILAENTPAETFVDNVDRLAFDNWEEHEVFYPEGKAIIELPYPRAKAHRQVSRSIREQLAERERLLIGVKAKAVA
jgi:hypothetical protein